jgi:hypothetical protein
MSRWPVLTVSSILLSGCVHSVQPGLANAPWIGSTALADEDGIHDVIANGDEGCGRFGEHGPLRNRIPVCATGSRRAIAAPSLAPPTAPANGLVVPWLYRHYVEWLCPHGASDPNALAWSTMPATSCAITR